jgi:hypothetical protein
MSRPRAASSVACVTAAAPTIAMTTPSAVDSAATTLRLLAGWKIASMSRRRASGSPAYWLKSVSVKKRTQASKSCVVVTQSGSRVSVQRPTGIAATAARSPRCARVSAQPADIVPPTARPSSLGAAQPTTGGVRGSPPELDGPDQLFISPR